MSEFKVGDRVRVKHFGDCCDGEVDEYAGLLGTIAQIPCAGYYITVILDEDPSPSFRELGLPVEFDEIEKIDG